MSDFQSITYVRRNHVVGRSGIGALMSNQEGVSVIIAGLPLWKQNARLWERDAKKAEEKIESALNNHELSDYIAQQRLGVTRLIQPPVVTLGMNNKALPDTWYIPALRFPLWEFCSRCNALSKCDAQENPSRTDCIHCKESGWKAQKKQQVPILLACKSGHLKEIDWNWRIHQKEDCGGEKLAFGRVGNMYQAKCACGKATAVSISRSKESSSSVDCDGSRPWLPRSARESCEDRMKLFERQSTRLYYPDVDSSLHLPVPSGYSERLMEYLQGNFMDFAGGADLETCQKIAANPRLKQTFTNVTADQIQRHMERLQGDKESNRINVRSSELEALTAKTQDAHAYDGIPVLDTEPQELEKFELTSLDIGAIFSAIVAVHRLSETRVFKGFARDIPPDRGRTGKDALQQLWGFVPGGSSPNDSWLPAHRVFGEGIFFELNARTVRQWAKANQGGVFDGLEVLGYQPLSPFFVAHTMAHAFINAAAQDCGYHVASIRDRVYFDDDRYGFLIYTAEGDSVGTMGGLVELAQPGRLENLIETALSEMAWCGLDPVCNNPKIDKVNSRPGACHRCCFLPDTSCEWFNEGLDRAAVIGHRPGARGYLEFCAS